MYDFSQYGGKSDELVAVLATLPQPPDLSAEQLKRAQNQARENLSRELMKGLEQHVSMQDHSIPARDGYVIEARTYRPVSIPTSQRLPVYIHFHGGGFLIGTLASEDAICSRIVRDTGLVVLNVNYRHTPEHIFPTAWQDADDAFEWAFSHAEEFGGRPDQLIVGGVSAGGQLAASLVQQKLREKTSSFGSIKGQVLMIPALVHGSCYQPQLEKLKDPKLSSYVECALAPILPMERLKMFGKLLFPAQEPAIEDRRASPGNASAEEIKGMPPTVFGIAGFDPLRDEGLLYAHLLAENGVPTDVHVYKGLPHGFRTWGSKISASQAWDQNISEGIKWALSNPPAGLEVKVHVH